MSKRIVRSGVFKGSAFHQTWRGQHLLASRADNLKTNEKKRAVRLGDPTALRSFRRRGAYSTGR